MVPQEIKDLMNTKGFKIVLILILILVGIMSVAVLKLPNDNPIEQACEATIEQLTGVKLDLTPEEKE